MIIPDYFQKAAEQVASNASREELEEQYVWHETQDRWNCGDTEAICELMNDAGLKPEDIPDLEVRQWYIEYLNGIG